MLPSPTASAVGGQVFVEDGHEGYDSQGFACTPDQALDLAAQLISAVNHVNGIRTPTGVFA